ncbi:MATE family efflux transporter (plasmid) [Clostridium estertheticum]|uniref:MATE family efflux transporter n=1 Tax=Clostridium estertheticum TaxID=238834 RepID=UPI001C0E59C9|nr:MATE family efflux transporter [Clostridium estertheticum]MBU3217193.1 MATE family efflux transporter [Clostridium estertheticum]WAG58094.1 MATE family efflux transporter [Clostridium estertheticum]
MNAKNGKLQIMEKEKVPKALIMLGLPTIIGMLVTGFYNVVDAYFVGGLGTSQMGAVSIAFPLTQVIIGLGMTFGSGAASYISRLLGSGDREQANRTAATALYSSLIVGVVVIIISLCFLDNILIAFGATKSILPYARIYARIYIVGSIINIFTVTMNNLVTSEGATKFTMTSMLIGSIINIILNPIFIYVFRFGIAGSAIATVCSLIITMIFYLYYILEKKGSIRFSIHYFSFDKKIYGEIFKVGIPTLVYQLLTSSAIGLTNSAASTYGDSAVAAMGAVTRIMAMGMYVVFGYTKGFQPFAGYNYGAKRYDRLEESIKFSLKWSTIFCLCMSILIFIFAPSIISAFGHDTDMIRIGSKALRAQAVMFIPFGFQMVYACLFLALGKGKEGSIACLSRQGIFFIPLVLILPRILKLDGVIFSQPIADLLATLLIIIMAIKTNKKIKKQQVKSSSNLSISL